MSRGDFGSGGGYQASYGGGAYDSAQGMYFWTFYSVVHSLKRW